MKFLGFIGSIGFIGFVGFVGFIEFIEFVESVGFVELRRNTIDPRNPSNTMNKNYGMSKGEFLRCNAK